jgi:hypothetical protein
MIFRAALGINYSYQRTVRSGMKHSTSPWTLLKAPFSISLQMKEVRVVILDASIIGSHHRIKQKDKKIVARSFSLILVNEFTRSGPFPQAWGRSRRSYATALYKSTDYFVGATRQEMFGSIHVSGVSSLSKSDVMHTIMCLNALCERMPPVYRNKTHTTAMHVKASPMPLYSRSMTDKILLPIRMDLPGQDPLDILTTQANWILD